MGSSHPPSQLRRPTQRQADPDPPSPLASSSSSSSVMKKLWLTGISARNRGALGSVDLRASDGGCGGPAAPVVTNQQEEGACVLHALRTAYECAKIRRGESSRNDSFDPDAWFDRARVHGRVTRPEDAGLTFAEAAAALAELGGFPLMPAPPECIRDGGKCLSREKMPSSRAYTWARVGVSADHLALIITKLRVPVILGFGVPEGGAAAQFLDDPKGTNMVLPHTTTPFLSGKKTMHHAVILMGYDADSDAFIAQNSWGPQWGTHGGYFWIPAILVDDPTFGIDAMLLF